eukprot:CAMPEP_0184387458 /NCGR_PEP_ID=MMETSP0007-20130409/10753_1 /TAXON_ID=97485 /ORGANISM="Prymnesium parvum, Strain Texoma1" /LENGTH=101 /DNA_ID=CAMNT_0026735859 /DNA_START=146 /DNA_END=447 /DNA_ORIENTATION=-
MTGGLDTLGLLDRRIVEKSMPTGGIAWDNEYGGGGCGAFSNDPAGPHLKGAQHELSRAHERTTSADIVATHASTTLARAQQCEAGRHSIQKLYPTKLTRDP